MDNKDVGKHASALGIDVAIIWSPGLLSSNLK